MSCSNPYSNSSDVYSFGICLYELLSSLLPYDDIKNRDQILFMVGSGLLKPNLKNIRSDTPKQLRILLEQCIRYDRTQRPEFKKVFFFYFKNYHLKIRYIPIWMKYVYPN